MRRIFWAAVVLWLAVSAVVSQEVSPSPAQNDPAVDGIIDETTFAIPEEGGTATASGPTIQAFGIWDLLRMLFILALVVGAIYAVFYFIRRGNAPKTAETQLINMMGSQGLPGNRWLHLVSVQKQIFLIGSSDSSVNLISEITDQESIDELRLLAGKEQPAGKKTFAELLGGFFGGNKEPGHPGQNRSPGASGFDFIKRQRDRLKKM